MWRTWSQRPGRLGGVSREHVPRAARARRWNCPCRARQVVRKKRKTLVVDDFLVGEMELAGAGHVHAGGEAGVPAPDVLLSAWTPTRILMRDAKGSRWLRKPALGQRKPRLRRV
ncbi:MAG: hypothetical protein ACLS9I_09120 [Adlercreutzia equolifaciens]